MIHVSTASRIQADKGGIHQGWQGVVFAGVVFAIYLRPRAIYYLASSAASERNFSAFAFVHTKQRNCLSEASVEKLVYVRTNNLQFTKQQGVAAAAFSNDDDITYSDADY